MLVSIALTAATVCTARVCTKRLDETKWPETWDETRDASVWDETLVRLETISRLRPHPWILYILFENWYWYWQQFLQV